MDSTLATYNNLKDFLQVWQVDIAQKYPPFIDHLFGKIDFHISKWWKILILTLTKKSSEEISSFLISKWYKTYYLHSEIDTIERWEIINRLKAWEIDILVWVNLLREWIDLPEVTFIAILDADKEWFLRSTTSLVQIIWRAARNPDSEVVLYADFFTPSIVKSLWETYRRRYVQQEYNTQHWIIPQKAISNIKSLEVVKTDQEVPLQPIIKHGKVKRLKRLTKKEKELIHEDLRKQLDEAIAKWDFEKAAFIRDQIKGLDLEIS